jgi:peptidoglycan/LPS O-acetylase OafA/YrhL
VAYHAHVIGGERGVTGSPFPEVGKPRGDSVRAPILAPLGGAFYALRRGAPLRPSFAGAAAGLLACALAAMLYALHRPEDSPLFGAIWYSAVIALVTAAATIAGRRFFRWRQGSRIKGKAEIA